MDDNKKQELATELLNRFTLSLYQLRRSSLALWEKKFYAECMGLTLREFIEVLDFIIVGKYKNKR